MSNKTHVLTTRFTPEKVEQIRQLSKALGLNASQFINLCLLDLEAMREAAKKGLAVQIRQLGDGEDTE